MVSKNFYYRNILVRVNQEGIYNRLSQRNTRYWATILYYTLDCVNWLDEEGILVLGKTAGIPFQIFSQYTKATL
jgi:hypothetical protein